MVVLRCPYMIRLFAKVTLYLFDIYTAAKSCIYFQCNLKGPTNLILTKKKKDTDPFRSFI